MRVNQSDVTTELDIDDIAVEVAAAPDAPPGPDVRVATSSTGSVFAPDAAPSLAVLTPAASVQYEVRDSDHRLIETGTKPVSGGRLDLTLSPRKIGWFSVQLTGLDASKRAGAPVTTSFAVLPPASVTPAGLGLGVSAHFAKRDPLAALPLVPRGGFGWVRDEAYWADVETTQGKYDWSRFAPYLDGLKAQGTGRVLTLDFGNPLYDGGKAPSSSAAIAAYARYCAAAVERFGTANTVYEIWNEWNYGGGGNTPDVTPDAYLKVLKAAHAAIKAKDPKAIVVGGAAGGGALPWFQRLFELGGMQYLDQVSFHPYVYPGIPEEQHEAIIRLRALVDEHRGTRAIPLVISEQGYPTGSVPRASSEQAQADHLTRAALSALGNGVATHITYDLIDDGTSDGNLEHRFGVLRSASDPRGDHTPKPAYVAQAVLGQALQGATHVSNGSAELGGTTVLSQTWKRGTTKIRPVWALRPAQVDVPATGTVTVIDRVGRSHALKPGADGVIHLTVGTAPLYLVGDTGDPKEGTVRVTAAAATTADPVQLTWSVTGHRDGNVDAALTIDGRTARLSGILANGEGRATLALPVEPAAGERIFTGVMTEGGVAVGLVGTETTIGDPVQVQAVHALSGEEQVLRITVSNRSGKPHRLAGLDLTLGSAVRSVLGGTDLAAGASVTKDISLADRAPRQALSYLLRPAVEGATSAPLAGSVVPWDLGALVGVPHTTVPMAGAVPWAGLKTVDLATGALITDTTGSGAGDIGGRLGVSWDDDALYVAAEVVDDVASQQATGGAIWSGDSVQVAVASGSPGEARAWHEYGAALTGGGPVLWRWNAAGAPAGPLTGGQVRVVRDEAAHTTRYLLRVPWTELTGIDPRNRLLALSVVVNDDDGDGHRATAEWGRGIANAKDSAQFTAVRLVP